MDSHLHGALSVILQVLGHIFPHLAHPLVLLSPEEDSGRPQLHSSHSPFRPDFAELGLIGQGFVEGFHFLLDGGFSGQILR